MVPVCVGACLRLPAPGPAVTWAPTVGCPGRGVGSGFWHGRGFWGWEGDLCHPSEKGAHLVLQGFPELSDVPERPGQMTTDLGAEHSRNLFSHILEVSGLRSRGGQGRAPPVRAQGGSFLPPPAAGVATSLDLCLVLTGPSYKDTLIHDHLFLTTCICKDPISS